MSGPQLNSELLPVVVGEQKESENEKIEERDQDRKKNKKNKKEKEKEKEKKCPYDVKTAMANERTFFKWLWTAIHVGGIGSFVLIFYSSNDNERFFVVSFIWTICAGFVLYGLHGFYRRHQYLAASHRVFMNKTKARSYGTVETDSAENDNREYFDVEMGKRFRPLTTDEWENPYAPAVLVVAFTIIMIVVFAAAFRSGYTAAGPE